MLKQNIGPANKAGLSPVAGKPARTSFDAGRLTSVSGLLVLARIERKLSRVAGEAKVRRYGGFRYAARS